MSKKRFVGSVISLNNQNTMEPEKWVDLHADYLYNYALKRLNDDEMAQDLVQETFLAALEKAENFKGQSSVRTWLTAIMKYKIIDIYRKKSKLELKDKIWKSEEETEFFYPDMHNWKKEHWPMPFGIEDKDPLENKEFYQILQRCLQKLPPLWLAVFTMKHMEEDGTDTICEELKITTSNFWVVIHRAKVNLRSCLQRSWLR